MHGTRDMDTVREAVREAMSDALCATCAADHEFEDGLENAMGCIGTLISRDEANARDLAARLRRCAGAREGNDARQETCLRCELLLVTGCREHLMRLIADELDGGLRD